MLRTQEAADTPGRERRRPGDRDHVAERERLLGDADLELADRPAGHRRARVVGPVLGRLGVHADPIDELLRQHMVGRARVEDQPRADATDRGVDHRGVHGGPVLGLERDRDIDEDLDPGGRPVGGGHVDTIRRGVARPTIGGKMADRR